MKQIEICKLRNGVIVGKETYYVEHMDMFLRDTIDEYIDSIKKYNKIRGINNFAYSVTIKDVYVADNFMLYQSLKEKTDGFNKKAEDYKHYLDGVEKVMKKWYI
jgi:hypothetical protein